MLTKFWEKLGEGLAGEWSARALAPALAFWGGALLAWVNRYGWQGVQRLLQTTDVVQGVAYLVGALFLLAVSTALVEWLSLPVLRLAEGYWPAIMRPLRARLTGRQNRAVERKEVEWSRLAEGFAQGNLDQEELDRYARLDAELDDYPVDERLRLPTRLGNILRAAEEHSGRCYGLEITVTWPRLWLTLPEETRKELIAARQALDQAAQLFAWGVLFLVWTVWAWWALPVTLLVALVAVLRAQSAARLYAQLLRAAYDLNRFSLYQALRWPLPPEPGAEKVMGQALSIYLKRNLHPAPSTGSGGVFFQHPK